LISLAEIPLKIQPFPNESYILPDSLKSLM
jgi:hypothetical protein